jgi:hypothetical protein
MGQFHLHRSRANLRIGEHGIDGVDGAAGDADTREVGDPLGRGRAPRRPEGPRRPAEALGTVGLNYAMLARLWKP